MHAGRDATGFIGRRRFVGGAAALVATGLARPALSQRAGIVLRDVLGREVTLKGPVERAFLGMYIEDIIAIAGKDVLERTAALSTGTWRDWKSNHWKAYLPVLPALGTLPDTGEISDRTFSIEKLVAARPDVAIMAAWQVEMLGPQMDRLAAAGIPVVVVDLNAQTLDKHVATMRIIGRLFGREDRAERMAADYAAALEDIRRRVAGSRAPRRRVYLELGIKGPGEYGNTYDRAMWGPMIGLAGGDNIAAGKVGNWGPLTPEGVISAAPEAIFISGGEWVNNKVALRMGFGMAEAEARAVLRGFAARPGWKDLPAVREGRVHAVSQGMIRSVHDFTQAQFVAKMLHPEAFQDVDPLAALGEFYARWLPVAPAGTFMLGNALAA